MATLLSLSSACLAEEVECKDYWHTKAQWHEMSALCEAGVRNGDPVSQVAVAVHLLDGGGAAAKVRAEKLLCSAAAQGYDDAYYWLGSSQSNRKAAVSYLEMSKGRGGMGLLALALAADAHAEGAGMPKDFGKARATYRRAFEAVVRNMNEGIPSPPGKWWTNAKWFAGQHAMIERAKRYGFEVKTVDGAFAVVEVEPQPELRSKNLPPGLGLKPSEPQPAQ